MRALAYLAAAALAAAPAPGATLRVAVVSLRAPPQLMFTGKSAAGAMAAEASRAGGYRVMGPDEVERALGRDGTRRLVACGDEARCLAERARPLGVDRVLAGVLSRGESAYRVAVVHVDVRTGAVVGALARDIPIGSRRLAADLSRATAALLRGGAEQAGTLEVVSDPPGAQVLVDGEPVGAAPVSRAVKPGKHAVEARRAGYMVQEPHWVDVAAEGVTTHRVKLYPIPVEGAGPTRVEVSR